MSSDKIDRQNAAVFIVRLSSALRITKSVKSIWTPVISTKRKVSAKYQRVLHSGHMLSTTMSHSQATARDGDAVWWLLLQLTGSSG